MLQVYKCVSILSSHHSLYWDCLYFWAQPVRSWPSYRITNIHPPLISDSKTPLHCTLSHLCLWKRLKCFWQLFFVSHALNLKLFHTKISSHFTPSAAWEFASFFLSFPWTTPQFICEFNVSGYKWDYFASGAMWWIWCQVAVLIEIIS